MRYLLVLLGLLTVGCGKSTLSTHARAAAVRAASVSEVPVRWRLVGAPESPYFIRRVESPTGPERFLLRGDRVERHGERTVFAEQSLPADIERSCPSGTGYLHVTSANLIYASDAFLGKAVLVGQFEKNSYLHIRQCGPVVVLGPSDGNGPREVWGRLDQLEVGPKPECLRGALTYLPHPAVLHSEHGVLRGHVVLPKGTDAVTCRRKAWD